jgi:hypothetical protein
MINGKARISSSPGKGTQVLVRVRTETALTEDKI